MSRVDRSASASRLIVGAAVFLFLSGCGGGPAAPSASSTPTAGPSATASAGVPSPTPAPSPEPTAATASGPSLADILGSAPPPVPAGTTWVRVADDTGAFSVELPGAWTEHRTLPWTEADGTSSGSLLVAGPSLGGLGSDFSQPGVAIGISANPSGRTPREIVEADDYAEYCTPSPAQEVTEPGYTAAFRVWEACGGKAGAFVLLLVVAPAGGTAVFAGVFQGATQADLGYIEHVFGSITAGGGPVVPSAGPTAPPQSSQGYTATVDECLLQLNDAIAYGTVTNTDSRSHGYRVVVRFLDKDRLLLGESYWELPALDPGQSGRYEVRLLAMNGVTNVTCVLSEVLIRN